MIVLILGMLNRQRDRNFGNGDFSNEKPLMMPRNGALLWVLPDPRVSRVLLVSLTLFPDIYELSALNPVNRKARQRF
jgi:hypothetical protein